MGKTEEISRYFRNFLVLFFSSLGIQHSRILLYSRRYSSSKFRLRKDPGSNPSALTSYVATPHP